MEIPCLLFYLTYSFEYHKSCFSEEGGTTVVLLCMKAVEKKKLIQKCINAFFTPS